MMPAVIIETNPSELVAEGQCLPQDVQIFNLPKILQKRLDGQTKQREVGSAATELDIQKLLEGRPHVFVPKTLA